MSRLIEFKYVFSNGAKTIVEVYSLDQIEAIAEDDTNYHAEKGYKLIDRLQFTGLLDCNGLKIFDGDIVQSYHFTDENRKDHFLSHIVKWSDKFNGWFMLNEKDLSGNDGSIQMWVYMKSSKYTAKVIGNIHQNSELLK